MARPGLLSKSEVEAALAATLPGWALSEDEKALERSFRFADFAACFAFMGQVAEAAEALDHHPEWHNVYNRLHIRLTTHDAGGVTQLDFALAQRIQERAA